MKNILRFVPIFLFPLGLFAQNDKAVIDRVVATVGGEIILLSEVQEQYGFAKKDKPDLPEEYQCVVIKTSLCKNCW